MTVGEYSGVPLQNPDDTWRNGAVFLLRKPARSTASVSLDGWTTTVDAGQKVVITCGPSMATDFDQTFIEALNAANRGLDYLSVTGQVHCAIRDAPDDCLAWWPDAGLGGVVLRCQVVQPYGLSINMTAEVSDAKGNIVPSPPPPTPMADDVFRFIRMARTSDDLFDSYRNLFLAFESLLSDLRPRRQVQTSPSRRWWNWCRRLPGTVNTKWESERDWFTDALDCADKLVPLAALTPPHVTNHKKWINRWMYGAERSALMHAKRGQNYLLPHETSDRAELVESLGRLWDYIRRLIEKHLDIRSRSSSFSDYAIEHTTRGVLQEFPLVVSDDEGPLNPEVENQISPDATVVRLRSSAPRVDPTDGQLWRILAHCDTADLHDLSTIRRFGSMRPDGTGVCDVLSEIVGPLVLGGTVKRLEMDRGLRHVNPTGAPRQFSS